MNYAKIAKIVKIVELIGAVCAFLGCMITVFQLIAASQSFSGIMDAISNVPGLVVFARVGVFVMFFAAIAVAVLSAMAKTSMVGSVIGCIMALVAFIFNFSLSPISSINNMAIAGMSGDFDPASVVGGLIAILLFSLVVAIMSLVGAVKPVAAPVNVGYAQQGIPQQVGIPQQGAGYNAGFPQQNAGYPQQNAGFPQQNAGFPQQNAGFPQQNDLQKNAGFPQQDNNNQNNIMQ